MSFELEPLDIGDPCFNQQSYSPDIYGSLHLLPSDAQHFYEIDTSLYGKYELIDNILHLKPMTTGKHDGAVHIVTNGFRHQKRIHIQAASTPSDEKLYSKLFALAGVVVYTDKKSHLRPDLTIGSPVIGDEACYPYEHPPFVVIEITSTNRGSDFKKAVKYAKARVRTYVIVDRDVNHKGKPHHNPKVYVGTLTNYDYSYAIYNSGSTIDLPYVGQLSVKDLLTAPTILPDDITTAVQEEKERLSLAETKVLEAQQQASQAQQQAAQDREGKRRAKERSRRRKQALLDHGIDVSSSSSSNSSPVKK